MTVPATPPHAGDPADVPFRRPGVALWEPLVVLGGFVGICLAGEAMRLTRPATDAAQFTDATLASTLVLEGVYALLMLLWLRRRGWTPAAAAGAPGPRDVARGGGVWLGTMACVYIVFATVATVNREVALALSEAEFRGALSPWIVVVGSIVNSLFEEFLWLGYAIPTLAPRFGLRGACAASVLLRTAVHAYQGPLAIVSVLPAGLFLTWYYARTHRLWPVVVAHVLLDAIGLSQFVERVR